MIGRKLSTGSMRSFCLPPFYNNIVNKLLSDNMILVYIDCIGMLPLNIIDNFNDTSDEIEI